MAEINEGHLPPYWFAGLASDPESDSESETDSDSEDETDSDGSVVEELYIRVLCPDVDFYDVWKFHRQRKKTLQRLSTLACNVEFPNGNSLLHQFVLNNSHPNKSESEKYIKYILKLMPSDAPVNKLNSDGYTALHLAVLKDNILMVKALLSVLSCIRKNEKCCRSKSENTALHLAIKMGNVPIIMELINNYVTLDERNGEGYTPLDLAAVLANLDIVKLLVSAGCEIFERRLFCSSLHLAAETGCLSVVKYLVKKCEGADVRASGPGDETVLHYAARSGDLETVIYLVRCGADLDAVNQNNLTPLHCAIKSKSLAIVKYLVSIGADVRINGWTALKEAATAGDLGIIKCLIDKVMMDETQYDFADQKCEVLLCAVKSGNLEVIKFLIDRGENVNVKNAEGCTPLHSVTLSGNLAAVEFIFTKISDVNVLDVMDRTPLHYSVLGKNKEVVDFLVNKGANLEAKDKDGKTPFLEAMRGKNLEIVKLLLEKGADLYGPSESFDKLTPIHVAVKEENFEFVEFLLHKGANVNAKDACAKTPLHYAMKSNLKIAELLIEKGADLYAKDFCENLPIHGVMSTNDMETAEFLVKKGFRLDTVFADGKSIVHEALFSGGVTFFEMLMKNGVNVNSKCKYGVTPLHCALEGVLEDTSRAKASDSTDFMKHLLSNNADINIQDNTGESPLCNVMRSFDYYTIQIFTGLATELKNIPDSHGITPLCYAVQYKRQKLVKLFLEKGADVNAKNYDGTTALQWAVKMDRPGLVELLLEKGADPFARYLHGDTILHSAVENGVSLDVIQLLLNGDIDVNSKNDLGETPLHAAVVDNHLGYTKLLLERGASGDIVDMHGQTPLQIANSMGHSEIIRILQEKATVNASQA